MCKQSALQLQPSIIETSLQLLSKLSDREVAVGDGRLRGLDDGRVRDPDNGKVMMGYTDSWVVEVRGGEDEADKLADGYGFVNLGRVSK